MSDVCIIGAGSSGISSCQVLKARGLDFDCFEKGSNVGGLWRYGNDSGLSSAYSSLYINTSRKVMEYKAYPMPSDYPDYPHHSQIADYFDDYVDHFDLRDHIRFRTEVNDVRPGESGGWHVTTDRGQTHRYRAVLVANGHHWNPKLPEYPGEFVGETTHSHHYRTNEGFEGKNVLVVGFGNSAVDIACDTARVARQVFLSTRRGAHVVPKYLRGVPVDELVTPANSRLPFWFTRLMLMRLLKQAQGSMSDYGLPEPDHKLGEAHPTISSELLPAIGHGRVKPRPAIERLDGHSVRFVDGSEEQIDVIVWCTGYTITFPFLPLDVLEAKDNEVPLYRMVVPPDLDGLYFIALLQPLGAMMPLAEAQSEWVADLLAGDSALPSRDDMWKEIDARRQALSRRYVKSTRHTIQVDFFPYLRELDKERKAGRRRRSRGQGIVPAQGAPAQLTPA
ncbi:MAG TPA: NAD(P)-binding domain-containing protein [Thermoleophilaceae bacterium]